MIDATRNALPAMNQADPPPSVAPSRARRRVASSHRCTLLITWHADARPLLPNQLVWAFLQRRDAQLLPRVDLVRVFQHRPIGLEDRWILRRIVVLLSGDLR